MRRSCDGTVMALCRRSRQRRRGKVIERTSKWTMYILPTSHNDFAPTGTKSAFVSTGCTTLASCSRMMSVERSSSKQQVKADVRGCKSFHCQNWELNRKMPICFVGCRLKIILPSSSKYVSCITAVPCLPRPLGGRMWLCPARTQSRGICLIRYGHIR